MLNDLHHGINTCIIRFRREAIPNQMLRPTNLYTSSGLVTEPASLRNGRFLVWRRQIHALYLKSLGFTPTNPIHESVAKRPERQQSRSWVTAKYHVTAWGSWHLSQSWRH
jgi:hypothetical protein